MKNPHKLLLAAILFLAVFLRFNGIAVNPPGLYWDEAVIGYDAYSILRTGHDHHNVHLPLFFESFGDWKLPVYEYLTIPSIAILGLNEQAVRFPSAALGSFSVLLVYLLIRNQTKNEKLALCSALLLAISPWHIQFSRAGFESSTALFIFLLGYYLMARSIDSKGAKLLIGGLALIALSQYTYHAYRIFAPLFLIGLGFIYRDYFFKFKKLTLIAIIVFFTISAPIIAFTFSKEGVIRASSQKATSDVEFEKARLRFDQFSKPPFRFLSKYLYQKSLYDSQILLKNYLDHFSPVFLFFKGDQVGRHSQVDIGQINMFELPLILFGILGLKNIKNHKFLQTMILWLVLAPIPAAIVMPTPHANRSLQMVIPLIFLGGVGLNYVTFKAHKIVALLFCLWMLGVFLIYINQLFVVYPKKFAADWQDGNREMVNYVRTISSKYKNVYITNTAGVPYIYLLFYTKYDPAAYQKFGSPKGFANYQIVDTNAKIYNQKDALYVAPVWQEIDGNALRAIYDGKKETVYKVWELNVNK